MRREAKWSWGPRAVVRPRAHNRRSGGGAVGTGRGPAFLRLFLGEQLLDLAPLRLLGRLREQTAKAFEVLLADEPFHGRSPAPPNPRGFPARMRSGPAKSIRTNTYAG